MLILRADKRQSSTYIVGADNKLGTEKDSSGSIESCSASLLNCYAINNLNSVERALDWLM